MQTATAFEELYTTIKRLRNPGGCPWDIEQTPLTLRSTLLEETYEVIDAIGDIAASETAADHIAEELGDVLINIIMICYMFEQKGAFSVTDMIRQVNEKLIRRHPHVFGKTEGFASPADAHKPTTAETVLSQWDAIKETVEGRAGESALDAIPRTFPPLTRAYKLQKKAAKKGFDWNSVQGAEEKIAEELGELHDAIGKGNTTLIEEELGDMLFSLVNTARHLHIDPALALNNANKKFERRFRFVEQKMHEANIPFCTENLTVMDSFWNQAKNTEHIPPENQYNTQ